jgi:hypothetical protein
MKYRTVPKLAHRAGFTLRSSALGYMKPVSPTLTAYIRTADGAAPTSAHERCEVSFHDHSTGRAHYECTAINFERACAKVEAWKIRDLERRADASMGMLFLSPQAE